MTEREAEKTEECASPLDVRNQPLTQPWRSQTHLDGDDVRHALHTHTYTHAYNTYSYILTYTVHIYTTYTYYTTP